MGPPRVYNLRKLSRDRFRGHLYAWLWPFIRGGVGVKYCTECGEGLEIRWHAEDQRDRLVCRSCNAIRYENPRILVATMLTYQDKLLLCRRAEKPSLGKWNPPSGFMERGETLEQAAARETFEEVGVKVSPSELDLYTVTSLDKI